jgi:hypothetical protein
MRNDFDQLTNLVDPNKNLVSKLGVVGIEINSKIAALLSGLRISSGVMVGAKAADSNVDVSLATVT